MTLHTDTRVPVDNSYVALIGKAVYIFAYYEWMIIYIIEYLKNGFISKYSRGKPLTSGEVKDELKKVINALPASFQKIPTADLRRVCDEFEELIVIRNALIHAHPTTDMDGSQIFTYQTKITKPLPDITWSKLNVEKIIVTFDLAACRVSSILDSLR